MDKRSKAYRSAQEKIDRDKRYTTEEAVKLLKKTSSVKFDATAELHARLNINPKHAEEQVRSTISLPHGTGKTVRVAVFCEDDKIKAAKAAGAVEAGDDSLVEKVGKGWLDFDVAVATPSMMKSMAKVARVLGPKGLMPNPKAGTVTTDVEKTVKELVAGRIEFRNDKHSILHTVFGKLSFSEKQLQENLDTLLEAIKAAKPASIKSTFIESLTITSTMGPGIPLDPGQ